MRVSNPAGARNFSLPPNIFTSCEAHAASVRTGRLFLRTVKRPGREADQFYLVPRLRVSGAVPSSPHIFMGRTGRLYHFYMFQGDGFRTPATLTVHAVVSLLLPRVSHRTRSKVGRSPSAPATSKTRSFHRNYVVADVAVPLPWFERPSYILFHFGGKISNFLGLQTIRNFCHLN
jgi:hypothetical protein